MDIAIVKINGIEYKIKQSYRALMLFEEIANKSSDAIKENITDLITMFYCILKANNRETFLFSLDEFIEVLDADSTIIEVFTKFLNEQAKKNIDTSTAKKKK